MIGKLDVIRKSQKISKIRLDYAKANFTEDVYKKIHKSYIIFQITNIIWGFALTGLIFAVIFIPMISGNTDKLVTISRNGCSEVTYYHNGARQVADLGGYIDNFSYGDQYYIIVDNENNVLSVMTVEKYKIMTVIKFGGVMVILFGGIGLYRYLLRTTFAPVWTKYCKWFDLGRIIGNGFNIKT